MQNQYRIMEEAEEIHAIEVPFINPYKFNDIYPNGASVSRVHRGNNITDKAKKGMLVHPESMKGVALCTKDTKEREIYYEIGDVISLVISPGKYLDDTIKCSYNGINGLYNNNKSGISLSTTTDLISRDSPIAIEDHEIAVYCGPNNMSSKENITLLEYGRNIKPYKPMRLVVYFGPKKSRMWIIGYVGISAYIEECRSITEYTNGKEEMNYSLYYLYLV